MTQKQFDAEVARMLRAAKRRVQLLTDAASGSVKLRQVDVKKCKVAEHTRGAHVRLIAPAGWKSKTSP